MSLKHALERSWSLKLILLGFLFIGSLKTCFGVTQPLLEVTRARGWVPVPLTSGRATVLPFHGELHFKVEYRYELAGNQRTGERYAFLPPASFLSEEALLALQDRFPAECYVNPDNPAESVVKRDLPWQAYSWTGLAFLVCAALLLLWLRRLPEHKAKPADGG